LPYVCVDRKSIGADDSFVNPSSSSSHAAAADAGPPTGRLTSTAFTARTLMS
jgi:hypothetical protein